MRCLVIFESMYGNTKTVAEHVASGLGESASVQCLEVGTAPTTIEEDVDLVVVGGPTHAFGMSRASSRKDAAENPKWAFDGEIVSKTIGIREWLSDMTASPNTVFASFDTRIRKPHIPGSAAAKAAKGLRRRRLRMLVDPESFWVEGHAGPLSSGEATRAEQWGRTLADSFDRRHTSETGP